jgi:TonB family protein
MKFCPTCKTRYDEEILRFCTKDGTPLVEESEPSFTALPSKGNQDDLDEETVIRRKTPPVAPPAPDFEPESERVSSSSPRIVIPMAGEAEAETSLPKRQAVRVADTRTIRHQPPRKSNTATVVFLTVLGTIAVLAGAAGIYWFLNNQNSNPNRDVNYNTNFNSIGINLNTNLNVSNSPANFDYNSSSSNANANVNANANANANLKTPTPTKTPTATPTPETNLNVNGSINTNANTLPVNASPTPLPRPSPSASPGIAPTPTTPANRPVNAGILNSRAVNLPKPAYPPLAKQMRAVGQVAVQVLVDEAGNVTSAKATSGNPMLRAAAEAAARQSKFNPVRVNNQPVPASGVVLYNFTN